MKRDQKMRRTGTRTQRGFRTAGRARQRGISLLEVLVVLVILVFGIFSIIRIFPGGFFAIRSAENNTYADRLGHAVLQGLTKDSSALPEAILTGYMYSDGSDPDNALTLNNARYIQNEALTVPSLNKTGQSIYIASFGPIMDDATLTINGMPWTQRLGNSNSGSINPPQDELLTPQQTTYQVDLVNKKLALPVANYVQKFNLIVLTDTAPYSYTMTLTVPVVPANRNTMNSATFDQDKNINYNGNWFDPTDTTLMYGAGTNPVGNWKSVTLYRQFNKVAAFSTTDNDPNEYMLANPDVAGTTANLGAISFSPKAAPPGIAPLKAAISYVTYDWHILHEDRDVPDSSTLRLTLMHLKKLGAVQFDNTQYAGLLNDSAHDILILDTDTGQAIDTTASTQIADIDQDQTSLNPIKVSYAGGRIILPATYNGHRLRIFFAGDAEWAVAVQKAPSMYTRVDPITTGNTPQDNVCELKPGMPNNAARYAINTANTQMYFPASDAGKMIELDGVVYTDTSGNIQRTSGIPVLLHQDLTSVTCLSTGIPFPVTYLNPGDVFPGYDSTKGITLSAVRGISARAIVVWKETDVFKVHTVDTVLTRSQ